MSSKIPWLKPPNRALIVGVNEYDYESITNLRGCVRDAVDVATFLFADLGMPAENIRLLTSPRYVPQRGNKLLTRHKLKEFLGQAPTRDQERLLTSRAFAKSTLRSTRANIIDGIRDFLGNAQPGEEVLFYYSGHGSTNMLADDICFGDETGETLVPADAGVKLPPKSADDSSGNTNGFASIDLGFEDTFSTDHSSDNANTLHSIESNAVNTFYTDDLFDNSISFDSMNWDDDNLFNEDDLTEDGFDEDDLALQDPFEEEESSPPQVEETYQILDRELRYLVAELLDKQIQLTIIADSCHSGGVDRGTEVEVKKVHPAEAGKSEPMPRLTSPGYLPRDFNSLLDGQADVKRLEELYSGVALPYTLIAGCLPTELSYEVKSKDDARYRGAMTSSLLHTLRTLNAPVTYRELARVLRGSIPEHSNKENQHPNITGIQERLPFSNQTIRRSYPVFAVQKIRKRWIELDGGQLEGVNQNCILTCYSDWSLTTPQGEWKVTKSRANTARAVPLEGSKPIRPEVGQPLMLKQRAERPTVFFYPNAEKIANAWRNRGESALEATSVDKDKWRDNSSWKGTPYLVEVFSEDANYTVQVENNLLIVKGPDGIIDALHKQIHDPEAKTPTTIPFHLQYYQTPDFLSFLIDRIINYQTFVAKKPNKKALKLNFSGEEPEIKVEAQLTIGERAIPLAADKTLPLPEKAQIKVTVSNQNYKKKNLYVNVYHLDPELYFAERIWPSDGTDQLQHDRSRSSIWELSSWQGGLLNLKLIVSTEPLNLEEWPCGAPDWDRGASMGSVRALKPAFKGWNAYHFVMGLTKKATYEDSDGRFGSY